MADIWLLYYDHIKQLPTTSPTLCQCFSYLYVHLEDLLLHYSYIPFLALCCYLTYRLLKPCYVQYIRKNMRKTVNKPPSPPPADQAPIDVPVTTVSLDDYVADDLYADRLLNPDEYKEQ